MVIVSGQSTKTVVVERADAGSVAYWPGSTGLVVLGDGLSSSYGAAFNWPGELTAGFGVVAVTGAFWCRLIS